MMYNNVHWYRNNKSLKKWATENISCGHIKHLHPISQANKQGAYLLRMAFLIFNVPICNLKYFFFIMMTREFMV